MTSRARHDWSFILLVASALAACSNDAAQSSDVAVASAALAAADGATAAIAEVALTDPPPLTAAEVAARAAIGIESADVLTGAARRQYYEARRDAARKAVALQRRAIQRVEVGRRERAAQGADTATLGAIDSELSQLKAHAQNLQNKLQNFEQRAAATPR